MEIPSDFIDLFERDAHGTLATLMPGGFPHLTVVWVDHDGEHVLINTARGRRKVRNVERDPRVGLAVIDPDEPERYLSLWGEVVEIAEEGAIEHDDALWRRYKDRGKPEGLHADATRVILRIRPERVLPRSPP